MRYNGKELKAGEIDEWTYEDFIDYAYGRGDNLKNTKLWKKTYQFGFVCPDEEGGWLAFAYDGQKYLFLGTFSFDEVFEPEEEDWYDYRFRMMRKADRSDTPEAIGILRDLYLDDRNTDRTPKGVRIAGDPDCISWMIAYWSFTRWNNHGNEPSFDEIDGFQGLVDCITQPESLLDYLVDSGERELADRLYGLHRRYLR